MEKSIKTRKSVNPAKDAINSLLHIKALLKTGRITFDEAMDKSKEYFPIANKRIEEIAKEHGMKPKFLSFVTFMQ